MAKNSLYNKVDKRVRKISATVGAVAVLVSAAIGAFTWLQGQFTNAISSQIDEFRQEVRLSDTSQDQAITRLELVSLIKNDPTNVVAIEKMARYYFVDLDGDQYMTAMYSDWAREYGGDMTIVIGEKK